MKITDEMIDTYVRVYRTTPYVDNTDVHVRERAALAAVAPLIAVQELRDAADLVDRGPSIPLPPSIISALLRERADDLAAPSGGPTGGTPND